MVHLTQQRLRALLHYDVNTGIFTRRIGVKGFASGTRAGTLHCASGYVYIGVDRCRYRAHRLAWFYVTGRWPREIDHRNGNRSDNRWENLREATRSQNNANAGTRCDNSSGAKGVSWDKSSRRWRAYINIKGCQKHLGRFDTHESAKAAYAAAACAAYGEFART